MASLSALAVLALASVAKAQTYSATYTYIPGAPGNGLPDTTETGQLGTNNCGTTASPNSLCQNVFVNSIDDFCLWAPPYSNGQNATIGETEQLEVAYCLKDGYGTRLFPDGTILGAHFVQTPDYVQVTGIGDFTKVGIPGSDAGGELDPHGATGLGNPIGGLVFGNSFGEMIQYHEWTNFMSSSEFCIRACKPSGTNPAGLCNHIYDVMGCGWNMPGNYDSGYWDSCAGDTGLPMGVYDGSTFHQGEGASPPAHPAPNSSDCVRVASLASGTPVPTTQSIYTSETVVTQSGTFYTYLFTSAIAGSAPTAASGGRTGGPSNTGAAGANNTSTSKNGATSFSGSAFVTAGLTIAVGALVGVVLTV